MASGKATKPTVIPAMTSFKNLLKLYSRRQMTDLGSQRSSNFREMAGHIYTIMTAVAVERNNQQGTKGRGGVWRGRPRPRSCFFAVRCGPASLGYFSPSPRLSRRLNTAPSWVWLLALPARQLHQGV